MICSVDGCGKKVAAKGLCHMHYARQRRNGTLDTVYRDTETKVCTIDGCGLPVRSRGLCNMHYMRQLRGSNQAQVAGHITGGDLIERVRRHVGAVDEHGHRLWTGAVTGRDTPMLTLPSTSLSARRIIWADAHGDEAPADRWVIAGCGTDRCVSPDHLELVEPGYHNRKSA